MKKLSKKGIFCIISGAVSLAVLMIFNFISFDTGNEFVNSSLEMTLSRTVCGITVLFFVLWLEFDLFSPFIAEKKALLFLIPCLLVAINNLPIIALATNAARVESELLHILLFALECTAVAFFEEISFRGILLPLALEKHRSSALSVFFVCAVCSVVFGLFHIANLFSGSGAIAVLMQIGYSFLIGGMCSAILIKTGNIFWCILVHAVYNFCGDIVPRLGEGKMWDTPTVIITVILSISVTAFVVVSMLRTDVKTLDKIYSHKQN